jgi:chromosome segregation protein
VYLKRLELQGFKSFASRTSFDFGQGLTAIVGPNGSGKSNIADALRWVLGEQSSKLIRAKKLDDVIYAGSEKRARADRVEVTMVLDNSTGWLPVDSTEVSITRRGSRSGDSDYFLNGQRAKLREIQIVLATAEVSQNSYAIIGQGLVESILNLRPEERRQLVEEAADIQRYRLKIEEAEMRLKQTRENVERVKLLIKEIAPRMTALERQAKRAGEHARLTHMLEQSLREYYEHRWARAQEAVTVARAAHDQAQADFIQARVSLETIQREVGEVTSQLEQTRRLAAASKADRDRLEGRVRDAERRLAVAGERRDILSTRLMELREEFTGLEADLQRAEVLVNSGDDERTRLEEAVAAARKVAQEKQAEVNQLEQEFRQSNLHAADAEARSKRLQAVAGEMKGRIKRLADAANQLNREVDRLNNRRRSVVNQMAEHVRVIKSLRTQDEGMLKDASLTGERREGLVAEVEQLRASIAGVDANQNARRGKLEGLEARLNVLREAQSQSGPDEEGAITIEGAVGTAYELLRVPRGMEEAIAAALSDQLEGFVFERQADAIAAIESLVKQNGPRAVAIPMDTMKQVYPLNLMKEKGVVGVASQLVKYQQKYEKLVNSLLGRVIIVQDAETAIRLLRRRLGTIVTMDGIVFDPAGMISGGKATGGKTFALAYERDMEALPREIEKMNKAIAATEAEAQKLRSRLSDAETALSAIGKESDSTLQRRLQLQDTLAVRHQKLAQLRGEIRGIMGAIDNAREQQASYTQQAQTLETERAELLEEAREAGETARHLGKADDLFTARQRAVAEAAEEAINALGQADAEFRSLGIQKESAQATFARLQAQLSARKGQIESLETELEALVIAAEKDTLERAEAGKELEELLAVIQPDQEGTHHLEARQTDLNKQVTSAQRRMFDAERLTLETESEVRRWETEIENMTHRMAEDGMVMETDGTVRPERQEVAVTDVPFWMAEGEEGSGGLRPMSGGALIDPDKLDKEIDSLRHQIRALGPVNVEATTDYESLKDRHDFLAGQIGDLAAAEAALKRAIEELAGLMKKKFLTTFEQVARNFESNFKTFFGGGLAKLRLTDPKHPWDTGVEIEARPPGKRTHNLSQLSGGEKSLTSVSLLFALLQANPAPFCVLDEVDAMLDEANVGRFAQAIKEQSKRTQFVVVTHNRRTIERADSIYGISMAPDAASRVLSMRLGDVPAAVMEN